jgi:hypothetical protein
MKKPRILAVFLLGSLLVLETPVAQAVSCLLFPLACLKPKKKFGEDMEGRILDIRENRTVYYEVGPGYYGPGWSSLENRRTWYIWFKVSQTLYQAEMDQSMYNFVSYKPKRADWVGKDLTLRFMDKNWMGLKSAWVSFKRDNGKEWSAVVISIVGPNGVDECNSWKYCKPQAGIDREARETEQLATIQKSGGKSATDVAAAPVDLPATPADASAPSPGPAATLAPTAAGTNSPSCAIPEEQFDSALLALDGVSAPGDAAANSIDKWVQDNATGGAACADYHWVAADAAAVHRDWAAMQAAYLRGISMSKESFKFTSMMSRDIFRAAAPDGNRESYFNQVKSLEPPLPADYFQWFDPVLTAAIDKWGPSDAALQKLRARVTKP